MKEEEAKEAERYASEEQEEQEPEAPRAVLVKPWNGVRCLVSGVRYCLCLINKLVVVY